MQPHRLIHVKSRVETFVLIEEAMKRDMRRQFVGVAKPTLNGGVGDALRQAYDLNGAARDLSYFDDLLDQLN